MHDVTLLCALTSRFSRRPFRLCMVFPSWSMVSVGSRGRSPMVFLLYSFRLELWPRDLLESSAAASQRASLEFSSLMVPCLVELSSFCCGKVCRSWMGVFLSSSPTGLVFWMRFSGEHSEQPGSAPGGMAEQTKRLPVASFALTVCPPKRYKTPTTKASILDRL